MKRRIGLFLCSERNAGGVFQYSQAMLEAVTSLRARGWDPVVAYTTEHWRDLIETVEVRSLYLPRGRSFVVRSYNRLGLPVRPMRGLLKPFHPFARALIREDCDYWIFPAQEDWSYQIEVRSISAIHDLMHRYEPRFEEVSGFRERLRRERLYGNICRYSDVVLVDSELGKRQVLESYGKQTGIEPDHVEPLPYIAPAYIFERNPSPDFDEKYRLPPKFIFYPAQFWEHKNHRMLVEAVGLLRKRLPDIKLVLVGSKKNAYEQTKAQVERLGLAEQVSFMGYVPQNDVAEIYRRARALVMPTFFGPTNIPPLEAFATGCPALISGIYAMPEQSKDAALYFNPSSAREIADTIEKVWIDDRLFAELRNKGYEHSRRWSQLQFNERLFEILERALSRSSASRA